MSQEEVPENDNSIEIRAYRERYVAFIDILGFTRHVEESETDWDLFVTLRQILSPGVLHIAQDQMKSTVIQFSDSIVISTRNDPQGLKEIIRSVSRICDYLLWCNILTRGGITRGKLYDDSRTVFGPALIRAYQIEKEIAVYPRILVDKSLDREVESHLYHESHFRRDFDAWYHLDILKLGPFWTGSKGGISVGYNRPPNMGTTKEEWLNTVKESIEEGLERQKNNPSIMNKYVWMAVYFNSFVRKSKDFHISAIKSGFLRKLP